MYKDAPGNRDDLGASATPIDDTTGDGIDELAIGAPGSDSSTVWILEGGAPPGQYSLASTAPLASMTSSRRDGFGTTVTSTDYDDDGYGDVFVSAPQRRSPSVYEFSGPFADARDATDADVRWVGDSGLGLSMAVDGDVSTTAAPTCCSAQIGGLTSSSVQLSPTLRGSST